MVTAVLPHIVFYQLSVSSTNNLEVLLLSRWFSSYDVNRHMAAEIVKCVITRL